MNIKRYHHSHSGLMVEAADGDCVRFMDANALLSLNAELLEALEHARLFIRNGVELGYITMPDADTPDPAHETLPKIEAAIAKARSQS